MPPRDEEVSAAVAGAVDVFRAMRKFLSVINTRPWEVCSGTRHALLAHH
jgi:hypothetical protein